MMLKHTNQLIDNNMEIYAEIEDLPVNEDKYNLFALRADLHLIFDRSAFVFIPKSGQLRVHFLTRVAESGILYHDTLFNDHNRLARAFMLARFGWAVIQLAKRHVQDPELFNFSEDEQDMSDKDSGGNDGDGDGPGGGSKDSDQNESGMKVKSQYARSRRDTIQGICRQGVPHERRGVIPPCSQK